MPGPLVPLTAWGPGDVPHLVVLGLEVFVLGLVAPADLLHLVDGARPALQLLELLRQVSLQAVDRCPRPEEHHTQDEDWEALRIWERGALGG